MVSRAKGSSIDTVSGFQGRIICTFVSDTSGDVRSFVRDGLNWFVMGYIVLVGCRFTQYELSITIRALRLLSDPLWINCHFTIAIGTFYVDLIYHVFILVSDFSFAVAWGHAALPAHRRIGLWRSLGKQNACLVHLSQNEALQCPYTKETTRTRKTVKTACVTMSNSVRIFVRFRTFETCKFRSERRLRVSAKFLSPYRDFSPASAAPRETPAPQRQ